MIELPTFDFKCLEGLKDCPAPPRPRPMTMEEYCEFMWDTLQMVKPELLERQRQLFDQDKAHLAAFRL